MHQILRFPLRPLARIRLVGGGVSLVRPDEKFGLLPEACVLLELFARFQSSEQVYANYAALIRVREGGSTSASVEMDANKEPATREGLLIVGSQVWVLPEESLQERFEKEVAKLVRVESAAAREAAAPYIGVEARSDEDADLSEEELLGLITPHFLRDVLGRSPLRPLTQEEFERAVTGLYRMSVLSMSLGRFDLGSFGSGAAACAEFGYTRGTPIDRVFLNVYIDMIRAEVQGPTLEIGGKAENRHLYRFQHATEYVSLDLDSTSGADVIADVHSSQTFPPESWQSIVAFNVLEHCEKPWLVVDNILSWLKPGGKVFCVVPNAQRLHAGPSDYWRILPDGMTSLFSSFSEVDIIRFGNLLTSQAALSGLSAEELRTILAYSDKAYPTVCCLSARKPS